MLDDEELNAMVPSPDVRQFVRDTGYTFTDWQKAALLSRGDTPTSVNRSLLYALKEQTADTVLKQQLTEYLDCEETAFAIFQQNSKRESVYILTYKNEDDETATSYFFDYTMALRFGTQAKAAFQICKYPVGSGTVVYEAGLAIDKLSTARFDENGRILFFDNRETPSADSASGENWNERFEHKFYEAPNPFERGDIVRLVEAEHYGIVETSQKEWFEILERFKSPEWSHRLDQGDVQIRVALLDEDGSFYHRHINPVDLERYVPEKTTSSFVPIDVLDSLLLCASDLYRGKGSLDDLGYFQEIYKYQNEKDNGKG